MVKQTPVIPHVLIFPLPLQGPVNSMLKLAEILSLNGVKVTFLNSSHVQRRLLRCTAIQPYFARYPDFRFEMVPDGLPEENPRTGDQILNLLESIEAVAQPVFRRILGSGEPPVTCLIADGVFTFAVDAAREAGVPLLYFDTISPCGLWSLLCLPSLIQAGEVPFGDEKLDEIIRNAPGMEGVMRRRDLPSFFRIKDADDPIMQQVIKEANHIPLAQGLIFNTFDRLEAPILSQMRSVSPNTYAVGPLHAHLKTRLATEAEAEAGHGPPPPPPSGPPSSIWEEDRSCVSWLDRQPPRSVVYVSIGSLAVMTGVQLYEIWHGLVNSGARFLWVRRPGSVSVPMSEPDGIEIPPSPDLLRGTEERGCLVGWAPQEEVLAHPAVGGFFTHCGWNSTLESIAVGVPMVCWPFHADQQVNSRYVGEVWKLGVDMKDSCDRVVVEKMIREVMESRKDEFLERGEAMARAAGSSVGPGGSSYVDMDRLIEDIKMMKIKHMKQN